MQKKSNKNSLIGPIQGLNLCEQSHILVGGIAEQFPQN